MKKLLWINSYFIAAMMAVISLMGLHIKVNQSCWMWLKFRSDGGPEGTSLDMAMIFWGITAFGFAVSCVGIRMASGRLKPLRLSMGFFGAVCLYCGLALLAMFAGSLLFVN